MQRQRTPQQHGDAQSELRASARGAANEWRAVADEVPREDLDGQLGPDELPDASEVVMNREAKLHRG